MKKFFQKDNKGFTLVELIVVIAVLAVITVVAAPKFIEYVEKSRVGTDKNALGEVVHATEVAYVAYGKEKNENEIQVRISSKGIASYAPTTSTLAQKVAEIMSEEGYIYKSETYRNSTHIIVVDENGIAKSDSNNHIDVGNYLAGVDVPLTSKNGKEVIEGLIFELTGEKVQTGTILGFIPVYETQNGYEMTESDWEAISDAAFKAGADAKLIEEKAKDGEVDYFLGLLEDAGINIFN